jgi:hypothetical protein
MKLGKDKDGYTYHYFPSFNEVRIYKMAKVPDTKVIEHEPAVKVGMKCMGFVFIFYSFVILLF